MHGPALPIVFHRLRLRKEVLRIAIPCDKIRAPTQTLQSSRGLWLVGFALPDHAVPGRVTRCSYALIEREPPAATNIPAALNGKPPPFTHGVSRAHRKYFRHKPRRRQ